MGKPQETFCGQYDYTEAPTLTGAKQHETEGHVDHKLYLEDQGTMWRSRFDQCHHRWWWDSAIRLAVLTRENPPSFFDLQSLLLVKENHVHQRNNAHDGQMLYSSFDGGRGHDRGRRGRFGQGWQNQEHLHHLAPPLRRVYGSLIREHPITWHLTKNGFRNYGVVKDLLHDIKINLNIVFSNIWSTWTHNLINQA